MTELEQWIYGIVGVALVLYAWHYSTKGDA